MRQLPRREKQREWQSSKRNHCWNSSFHIFNYNLGNKNRAFNRRRGLTKINL